MNTLSEALELLEQGIYCLPCQPDSKYLLKGISPKFYLENPPSIGNYLDWFNGTQNNLAILAGNGLVVLDFDSLPDFIIWQSSYGIDTRIVESRRGFHAYFWVDEPINHTSELCEVKYNTPIVAPPSIVNGVGYKVIEDKEISRIATGEELGLTPSKEGTPAIALINNGTINVYGTLNAHVFPPTRRQSGIIDSIKQGFKITDLFPNYQPSGDGKAMAHCPMPAHQNGDRNPSLSLDLITNRAQCLKPGCPLHSRRGNDVIDAYSILHGLNIKQAIAAMASELGL